MMLKTSQAMGCVRQGVGDDASASRRRHVGDASASHRRRVALSARRLHVCDTFTIRRQGIGEASASCQLRVDNAIGFIINAVYGVKLDKICSWS